MKTRLLALILVTALTGCVPLPAEQPVQQSEAEVAAPPLATTARVPLEDALDDLAPRDVWQNFYSLTQIPHKSGHVEGVAAFLVEFGQGLGFETLVDGTGNVLIRKPAAAGKEDRPGVILQAHMDMVVEADKPHDPLTDPIEAYVDGDWLAADGTTLGADDGIGVAIAMAVLQSKELSSGPIEALFTVDEETTMAGANGLQPGWLRGTTYLNLDGEEEDTFTIGSAGGATSHIEAVYTEQVTPAGFVAFELAVSGLTGGHSGVDIHLGLGNAIMLLARFLDQTAEDNGLRVAQVEGGTAHNAIPREASAVVVVPEAQQEAFLQGLREYQAASRKELGATDPGVVIEAIPAEMPSAVMDAKAQHDLFAALVATPLGMIAMSEAVPGLVETSNNVGIILGQGGLLKVTCLSRSSVEPSMDKVLAEIQAVWEAAGATVAVSDRYAGWAPNAASPILARMQQVREEMGREPAEVTAVHAGLECGTVVAKYPGMDAVSIGPTMHGVHRPGEELYIPSVESFTEFVMKVLESL